MKAAVHWLSLEEVGQSYEVRPRSHHQAADGNQPRTMELRTEIADKGDHQQVTCSKDKIKKSMNILKIGHDEIR